MDILIKFTTAIGDLVFSAVALLSPIAGLVLMSAVLGFLMLMAWRYTSNQAAIADVRRKIAAHLLATRLFKDSLAVTFRAQRQIIWQAIRLLGHAVRPTLIMLIPFTLVLSQIGLRYESRPAPVGKPIRVTATVKPGVALDGDADKLKLPEGLTCKRQDPCRAEAIRTIDWRITPSHSGDFLLAFGTEPNAVTMPLCAGEGLQRISGIRGGSWFERLLYSAEPGLPASSGYDSITIHYPQRSTLFFGYNIHWLITLLVLSIVFALILKPILKVHV